MLKMLEEKMQHNWKIRHQVWKCSSENVARLMQLRKTRERKCIEHFISIIHVVSCLHTNY